MLIVGYILYYNMSNNILAIYIIDTNLKLDRHLTIFKVIVFVLIRLKYTEATTYISTYYKILMWNDSPIIRNYV